MSHRFLSYLKREHDRLQAAIDDLRSRRIPDEPAIARLEKQKLAVVDQITMWQRDCSIAA